LEIVFLQTADPVRYKRMMDATARTVIEYCRRHGCAYENYVGVKRGYYPWHATFNRMFQLHELVSRGFRGWAVYLDADAYVHDLDFDLAAYLRQRSHRAGIMTTIPGQPNPWCINAGILLFNLGQELGRELAQRWLDRYLSIDDVRLRAMEVWDDGDSDQSMLFELLQDNLHLREAVEYDDGRVFNAHDAQFLRQLLRSLSPDFETRTRELEALTDSIVSGRPNVSELVVTGAYRAILGRNPDKGGLAGYANFVDLNGIEAGTEVVLTELLKSEEYRRLQANRSS
jgi:hypothetical protein